MSPSSKGHQVHVVDFIIYQNKHEHSFPLKLYCRQLYCIILPISVRVREVPVTQYLDKDVPEIVNVEVPYDVHRNIPVPLESITTFEYKLVSTI